MNIKNKLIQPLTIAIIQVAIIYYLFFSLFFTKDHYYFSLKKDIILNKIKQEVNQCGYGSWLSWIIVDTNENNKNYYFEDVIGCNKLSDNCSFSVKDQNLNPYYNKYNHKLDSKSYSLLSKMETGSVAYFNDVNNLKSYTSLYKAITNSNLKINNIGISITKDVRKNIVYIFTLTNTHINKCDKYKTIDILEELSIFSRGNM